MSRRKHFYIDKQIWGYLVSPPEDDYRFYFSYSRLRDAVRGFTRYVNRRKLRNVALHLPDGTELIYK